MATDTELIKLNAKLTAPLSLNTSDMEALPLQSTADCSLVGFQ